VKSVHLKDTLGGFHDPNFPVLGEGVVDFKSVFEVLNAVGFFGPFTLELEGPKVHTDSPEEMEKHVLRCVEHLRSLGVLGE
jgi:inosose dehydratase